MTRRSNKEDRGGGTGSGGAGWCDMEVVRWESKERMVNDARHYRETKNKDVTACKF